MPKRFRAPQEKKRLSLQKDRRNTYGENDKSSRKNIPRSKAIARRTVRRKSAEFERSWPRLDELEASTAASTVTKARLQKGKFRKTPDTPLGKVIGWTGRRRAAQAHKRSRAD